GFSPAVQGAEVERLLTEWRLQHPDVTVTTLRSAPVVGPGAERLPARIILGRPALRVRGAAPPVQVVHVDDLAAALVLAATSELPGAFNVAADGWLTADHARALLPKPLAPALHAETPEGETRKVDRRHGDVDRVGPQVRGEVVRIAAADRERHDAALPLAEIAQHQARYRHQPFPQRRGQRAHAILDRLEADGACVVDGR